MLISPHTSCEPSGNVFGEAALFSPGSTEEAGVSWGGEPASVMVTSAGVALFSTDSAVAAEIFERIVGPLQPMSRLRANWFLARFSIEFGAGTVVGDCGKHVLVRIKGTEQLPGNMSACALCGGAHSPTLR